MKILRAAFVFIVAAVVLSYWLPLKGPWADFFLSNFFSSKFGFPVVLREAEIRHWRMVRFEGLEIFNTSRSTKMQAGPGAVRLGGLWVRDGKGGGDLIVLKDLMLPMGFLRSIPLSFLAKKDVPPYGLVVQKLRLDVTRPAGRIRCHVTECESKDMRLKGGVEFEQSKLVRMHGLFLFSPRVLKRLPEAFRPGLLRRGNGWEGLRVVYVRNLFTVLGRNGPLFQAGWQ